MYPIAKKYGHIRIRWQDRMAGQCAACPEIGPRGTPLKGNYFRVYLSYFSDCGDILGIFPGGGQPGCRIVFTAAFGRETGAELRLELSGTISDVSRDRPAPQPTLLISNILVGLLVRWIIWIGENQSEWTFKIFSDRSPVSTIYQAHSNLYLTECF